VCGIRHVSLLVTGIAIHFATACEAGVARSTAAGDKDKCEHSSGLEQLDACNRLIASKKISAGDKAIALQLRGNARADAGDFSRALEDYDEALRLSPKFGAVYHNRGTVWREWQEWDRAILDFNEAIRLAPADPAAYTVRGDVWRQKGDLVRALDDLNRAIAIGGIGPLIYSFRGDVWRYRGEFSRALADYDKAMLFQPKFAYAYTGRGLTLEKMGDFTGARTDFERALTFPASAFDTNSSAQETARARLAAIKSGAQQPTIPSVPAVSANAGSLPTPPALVPAAAVSVRGGRRVALVVGNSSYQKVSGLLNPANDASVVAASLRNIGFDVILLADATREKLTDALRSFAEQVENADWAMVYYAGHGIEIGGTNYLIPVDAKLAADRDAQFEAIPLERVMSATDGARKLKLIILDACRDNPFAARMRQTIPLIGNMGDSIVTRSVGRGLARANVSGATLVVYAAKHGQVALDGEGRNSPFTVALVQRIATPGVEISKIFRLVRDDVMEATAGRQEPYTYGSLPGREEFFFVGSR